MADTGLPPWEEATQAQGPASAGGLPPWEEAAAAEKAKKEPKVGVVEDMAKAAGPSLFRGAAALITTPRAISDLTGAGANWAVQKLAPPDVAASYQKWHDTPMTFTDAGGNKIAAGDLFPSYDQIVGDTEKEVTGPLYNAQRMPGRIEQTALEAAPALAAGGEGLLGTVGKAVGAGLGSETLGDAAAWLHGKLPNWVPSWAEPVGQGIGAMVGTGLPAATRRAVTPLPMTDQRLATVNALRTVNPELVQASTAGQLTESPKIAGLEARSPRMEDLPQRQESAYTQGVMRQAGSNGMFDTAGLGQARQVGEDLRLLQNAHEMTPAEFALLNRDVNAMGRPGSPLYRAVGPSAAFKDVQDQIRLGPSGGKPQPLNMTGQRYGALKQIVQSAGEGAPTTHEADAIFNARDRMKQAFQNSMPPDDAERLQNMDKQYSNFKTIENIPTKADQNTITPDQVFSKAKRGSDLETHATNASSVMRPLPEPNREISDLSHVLGLLGGSAVGALTHGAHSGISGAGYGALEGALPGLFGLPHAVNSAKDVAGRITASPVAQAYLKNQQWRPGPASQAPDLSTLLRVLAARPEQPAITGSGK